MVNKILEFLSFLVFAVGLSIFAVTVANTVIDKSTPSVLEPIRPPKTIFTPQSTKRSKVKLGDRKIVSHQLPEAKAQVKRTRSIKDVRKLTLDPERTITITGSIGGNALQAAAKVIELNKLSADPIFLVLSSPGGSVVDGSALISAIQVSKAKVYTICYTFCASMAAMIHQYGYRRYATDRSILMFHPASVGSRGDVDRIYSFIRTIKRYVDKIELEIANRLGWKYSTYKRLTSTEYWIDSEDAKRYGVIDQIVYLVPGDGTGLFKFRKKAYGFAKRVKPVKTIRDFQWIYRGEM